jgi:hypothetical protein
VPHEVLKKRRITDINVKKGSGSGPFRNDFRISASVEEKYTNEFRIPPEYALESTRIKKRFKY